MIYIKKQEELELLIKAVEISSDNGVTGEIFIARFLKDYFSDTNCETFIDEFDKDRANIISVLKGKNSDKCLIINGHLDTVLVGDLSAWDTDPRKAIIKDGNLYGRGTCDMKGGLCALAYTFRKLALEEFVPKNDIVFIGTGDEEKFGEGAKSILNLEYIDKATSILIAEPTSLDISLGSKGALWCEFEIFGKSSHGAIPSQGINAINVSFEIVEEIKSKIELFTDDFMGQSTCTLTLLNGGTAQNMVPDYCKATVDIRTTPNITNEEIINIIENVVCEKMQKYVGCKIEKTVTNQRKSTFTEKNSEIVIKVTESLLELGYKEPKLKSSAYFTDASIFLMKKDIPAILFGPGDDLKCHKANEDICIDEYLRAIKCFENILRKY